MSIKKRVLSKAGFAIATLSVSGALLGACRKEEPKPSPIPAARPTSTKEAVRLLPWHVGTWTCAFDAEVFKTDPSSVKKPPTTPKDDDGRLFVGKGRLELSITDGGQVSGQATGALGTLRASGELDEELLRVWLAPKSSTDDQVGGATLVAARNGTKFEGKLRASTNDSRRLRVASITLERVDPQAPHPGSGSPTGP